jgi:hypothetical protein
MGDATRESPIPLQATIISSLGSFHKPLYVKNLSFAAYPLPPCPPLVLQSDSLSRAPPHPPSEEQRTGFSIGIGSVLWSQDHLMYNESANLYIRNLIPIAI